MASRSFIGLFALSTSVYLFDLFVQAYAKSTHSLELQTKISQIFGQGMITDIYLAAVAEALGLSMLVGFGASRLRGKKTITRSA